MKIIIFAGGVGTRLWPLSRKKSPKQFEKIVEDKSTLRLMVDRLMPAFSPKDFYISTNQQYIDIVRKQLKEIPAKNIIGEPKMRDIGPAVGLMTAILYKESPQTPFAILWSDHLVKEEEKFRQTLLSAEKIIDSDPQKIVFIAQKPRFASQNLGWIEYGEESHKKENIKLHNFKCFKYRPDPKTAKTFFESGHFAWNLGYFVTTPEFLWKKFQQFAPQMFSSLSEIQKAWGTDQWEETLQRIYPQIEKISFDNAILEKLDKSEAYVITEEFGWSDIGAWESLKEALQKSQYDNVVQGRTLLSDTKDCLVYNYNDKQLLATIDLEGMLVINTPDVVLICKKESVPKIKKMVESFEGTENEWLT